ncbi:alanine racemase [Marinigracilibium pacificum]|uniref:Alanine racemase n=1 Tax=Marinigracilibium pacificum TaxID=2729599 RepID=A0A848IUM1_9BACT|nr:alanine racemase [Marinigracilibium pacificum]NMM46985.1 alanine racemase [Marinigracilibium pacificum]
MSHTSYIEINSEAYKNNLDFIKTQINRDTIISSVVKGNAYGHGIEEFVKIAVESGVKHFSVYSSYEARRVFEVIKGKGFTLMIMGDIHSEDLEWAIQNEIEFFVFEKQRLKKAREISERIGKKAICHIEVETGMNRTGFDESEIEEVFSFMVQYKENLYFKALCTHFAGAESITNYVRVENQCKKFLRVKEQSEKLEVKPDIYHTCCSAALIRYPHMQFDLVRVGILQYGFWPSREIFIEYLKNKKVKESPLWRLISWKSRIMSIQNVHTGDYVGYGTTFLAGHDMKIAIVPIGYANGFSRTLSNTGRVLIRGERVTVVGIVNMNCLQIDVTGIEDVSIDDEVVIIGNQGDLEVTVSSFSELSDQLNYELLTRLPQDIPRYIK